MGKPTLKVMGVYRLETRPELISEALTMKYGDIKLTQEQKAIAVQATTDELAEVVLIDLIVKNIPADFDLESISQEGNLEKPYQLAYLTEDGRATMSRRSVEGEKDIRMAFYMHGFLQDQDLITPWGKLVLPATVSMDPNFAMIHPYRPRNLAAPALAGYVNETRNRPSIWEGKGFWIRAASYIIDLLVINIVSLIVGFVVGLFIGLYLQLTGGVYNMNEELYNKLRLPYGLFLQLFYFLIFEWACGATIGKLILRLRVVNEVGSPGGFGPVFVRTILRYVDGLFFGIPAAMSMTRNYNQRIGDRAARTFVVSSQDPIIKHRRSGYWWLLAIPSYIFINAVLTTVLFAFLL